MSFGSRCHLPPCRSVRTFTVKSPRLSIFSPPRPRIVVLSLSPVTETKQSLANRLDSRLSLQHRYRPRSPSVATSLLLMDMLPIVTAFKSTSSGHHSPSLELSLGRSSPSLELSLADAGTPTASGTQNRQESSLRGNLSHRVQTSVRFVPKDQFVAKREIVLASHPNNQGMDPLRLGDLRCGVSETSRKTSVLLNQESSGGGGIISVASFVDSSSSTSSPWSDTSSKDPKSIVSNGTFCEVSVSSSSQFPTLFPVGADLVVLH